MSACQWILWGPDSIWLLTHTGPATTRHTHTHTSALNSPLSFRHRLPWWHQSACWHGDPSITKSGRLGSPEHPTGRVLQVFNAYICVCARMLIWHFSKPCGAVPQLPSLYLGRLSSSSSISSVTRFIFSQLLIDVWLVREDYKLFSQSMHKII